MKQFLLISIMFVSVVVNGQNSQLKKIERTIGVVQQFRSWPSKHGGYDPGDNKQVTGFFKKIRNIGYYLENDHFDESVTFDKNTCILTIEAKRFNADNHKFTEKVEIDLSTFDKYGYRADIKTNATFMVFGVKTVWTRTFTITGDVDVNETNGFWIVSGNLKNALAPAQHAIVQDAGNSIIELATDFCEK